MKQYKLQFEQPPEVKFEIIADKNLWLCRATYGKIKLYLSYNAFGEHHWRNYVYFYTTEEKVRNAFEKTMESISYVGVYVGVNSLILNYVSGGRIFIQRNARGVWWSLCADNVWRLKLPSNILYFKSKTEALERAMKYLNETT